MNSAIERLLSLRIRDVMSRNLLTVPSDQTLAEAAASLIERGISAAPVVQDHGKCVGMLTATDFMRWEAQRNGDHAPWEHRVAARMTPQVHTVEPDATMLEAARVMCHHHIHRLPVVDDRGHVVGVVSSLDLVAAMVAAVEE